MTKFVLTGAAGRLCSQVLKHLLTLVPACDITVSLYNPAGAPPALLASGVTVRRGDYADPASPAAAFAGADALLLRRGRARRVYYTSLAYAPASAAELMRAHAATEALPRATGLAYTVLREGVYSESWARYLGNFHPRAGGDVCVPVPEGAQAAVAWASIADLGEATAKIMAQVRRARQRDAPLLTGTRAAVAPLLRDVLGRGPKPVEETIEARGLVWT
ncbi:hypothetical protein BD413DRAFT_615034 [Trametes elegans]|nr:hypothetical protein BD413DRAFT_615034 [Trametes elegans]